MAATSDKESTALAADVPARGNSATADSDDAAQLQSERVTLLGSMAAGLAHEFNNLLTVVLSSLDQLRRQDLDERGKGQLERAEWGARQAGRLAQQVLSFIRRQRDESRIVDVNAAVTEFDKMLGHIAGEGIQLVLDLAAQHMLVRVDPGQLELALLNLVQNAAHAMSGRGRIIIRTAVRRTGGPDDRSFVELSVSDRGSGMPPEVAARAMNPFFTTKSPGRGTGLGLWMVQRFVRMSQGKMELETAVGQGTTIRLLLPGSNADPLRP